VNGLLFFNYSTLQKDVKSTASKEGEVGRIIALIGLGLLFVLDWFFPYELPEVDDDETTQKMV
jgi:hypothetical protein